jgi:hypothetical protein
LPDGESEILAEQLPHQDVALDHPDELDGAGLTVVAEVFASFGMIETQHQPAIAVGKVHPQLRVPASWREGPPPGAVPALHIPSNFGELRSRTDGGRAVLELFGPLGAGLALDVAPAGTWTQAQAADVEYGLARLLLRLVEGPEDFRGGGADGFRVTYEMRWAQPLLDSSGSSV